MNIYLDIDGVILDSGFGNTRPANYSTEFLKYLTENHKVYWLTSHCKVGGNRIVTHLGPKLPDDAMEYVLKILPNPWSDLKTDGIDFTQDFRWIDDNAFIPELEALKQNDASEKLIKINLRENSDQLNDVVLYLQTLANHEAQ